ncbi:tetratricopeptide repeat-containing protein [Toxoplasma gondii GAB2-2007-GAL-DOM2]|uniref:Tetratricopeptide repeat-containing protein n=2 Tax=Toxoplasma gondii TaxID=5811 RepID=A0A086LC51_TOXGO|nr:tetratricopeptide repeat-containing protein [Toxoplasma gondii GAB2-2007-GAL-DOM2]KFG54219.1 tetratricopeptide repeat-containing protein [Toxoplasma gondii FOU]
MEDLSNATLARLQALKEEGNAEFKRGKFESAIEAYSRCLADASDTLDKEPDVLGGACAASLSSSDSQVAEPRKESPAILKRVAELKAQILCNRALCYQRTKQFAAAEADCTRAIALHPAYVKSYYRRAVALDAQGRRKECVEDLQTCLRLQPGNKEAQEMLAGVRDKVMKEEETRVEEQLPENLLTAGLNDVLTASKRVASLRQLGAFVQERKLRRQFLRDGGLRRVAIALKSQMDSELEGNGQPHRSLESLPETTASDPVASEESKSSADAVLPVSVEAACWELLLSVVQQHQADDEDDANKALQTSVEAVNAPLQVDAPVLECRQALSGLWTPNDFLVRLRQLLRAGVARSDGLAATAANEEAGKLRTVWRGEACDRLLRTMGCVVQLQAAQFDEDASFLEACAAGLECIDSREVQRAAVAALVGVADARRRLGGRVAAVRLRHGLEKCLEDALQVVSDAEHELAGEDARSQLATASKKSDRLEAVSRLQGQTEYLIITLIALLADKDRGKEEPPDMSRLVDQLLSPYFRPCADPEESVVTLTVGLKALRLILTAAREVARAYLISASSILPYLLAAAAGGVGTAQSGAAGTAAHRRQQEAALEVLLACMDFPELRATLLEANAVPVFAKVCSESANVGCWMRARLAAALARLSVHDEDVRIQVFDSIDFYDVLDVLVSEIRAAGGDGRQVAEPSTEAKNAQKGQPMAVGEETFRSLLEIFFFLSLHGDFKARLVTGKKGARVLRTLLQVANGAGKKGASSSLTRYLLLQSLCNIMRSREDRQRQRRRKGEVGSPLADVDDEQLQQLEELFKKLPEGAKPAANGEVDLGDKALATQLRDMLLDLNVVHAIAVNVCATPPPSSNVLCAAAQALKFLCEDSRHRGRAVQEGGIRTLLVAASGLEEFPDDQRNARQAAAQLCITTNPALFSYRESLDLVPCLAPLLKDRHELLQYEGALALTNLCALSEEVRMRAWLGGVWEGFEDLMFGENELLRAAGLEGWCNLSASPTVQTEIGKKMERFAAEKQEVQDMKLLLAFTRETNNPRAQSAAVAALAMLLANEKVARCLPAYSLFGNLALSLEEAKAEQEALIVRCVSALYNVWIELSSSEAGAETRMQIVKTLQRNQQKLTGDAQHLAKEVLTAELSQTNTHTKESTPDPS